MPAVMPEFAPVLMGPVEPPAGEPSSHAVMPQAPAMAVVSAQPMDQPPPVEASHPVMAQTPGNGVIPPRDTRRPAARRARPVASSLVPLPPRPAHSREAAVSMPDPYQTPGTLQAGTEVMASARERSIPSQAEAFEPVFYREKDLAWDEWSSTAVLEPLSAASSTGTAREKNRAPGPGARHWPTVCAITAAAVMMLMIAGYARRDDVMRHLPGTIRFYSALGLANGPSATLRREAAFPPVTTTAAGPAPFCSPGRPAIGCLEPKTRK